MMRCKGAVRSIRGWTSSFVDKVRIYARGGTGGQGSSKLGSVGGSGGDVLVCAVEGSNLRDIARLDTQRFVARVGGKSERSSASGKKGRGVSISVPPGTAVYDDKEIMVCDLLEAGMSHVLVRGGCGGSHMTPNWHGRPGERGVFVLKLKTIADIGLVGLPNAGKSTLLAALSRANPQVADYAFTTLQPEVGVITGEGSASIADLPGLVEGAHRNVGKGHRFLQHIERTRALLYVVDIGGFQLSSRHPVLDPYAAIQVLVSELELYCPGLAHSRQAILALNKMDTPHASKNFEILLHQLKEKSPVEFHSIIGCSALNKTGTEAIKNIIKFVLRS